MNSMLEALKKKMHGKEEPVLEIDIMGGDPHEKEEGEYSNEEDLAGPAPKLDHELIVDDGRDPAGDMDDQADGEMMEAALGEPAMGDDHVEEGGEDHMKILQALGDRSSGSGRGSMGLHERAAEGAKSKMEMLSKHKHKRG